MTNETAVARQMRLDIERVNHLEQAASHLAERGDLAGAAEMYRAASEASCGRRAATLLTRAEYMEWRINPGVPA